MEKSPTDDPSRYRILACSGSLDGGGSERQLWQLASRLDRRRFAPELFLLHRRGPYLAELPNDVPVHAFGDLSKQPRSFPPGNITRAHVRFLRGLIASRSIDLVYDRTFHMTMVTSSACRNTTPRVSVIVSPPSRDLPATEHRFVWLKRILLARAYRTASATICVSQEVADDAARYYSLQPKSLLVMPNPIDARLIRQRSREKSPSLLPHDGDRGRLLHAAIIGRFTAEKGHAFALHTASLLAKARAFEGEPELHLHFVGSGPLEASLKERVAELGLTAQVHFYGYLPNPYPILRQCDLALVPSRYEGFPNVALEALALGVPLLMTDYGPTARLIVGTNNERGQLVGANDIQAAADAIMDRARQPERWTLQSQAGTRWVETEHSIDAWMDQTMRLFDRLALTSSKEKSRQ